MRIAEFGMRNESNWGLQTEPPLTLDDLRRFAVAKDLRIRT